MSTPEKGEETAAGATMEAGAALWSEIAPLSWGWFGRDAPLVKFFAPFVSTVVTLATPVPLAVAETETLSTSGAVCSPISPLLPSTPIPTSEPSLYASKNLQAYG